MKPGLVRIISGTLRGRRVKVADVKDLRPTPDRVRETLFNWLAQKIPGARCLDLFAGTGILGFECLSRGAAFVEMVDESSVVIDMLQAQAKEFDLNNVAIYKATAPKQLRKCEKPFDVVFLDPPYQANLIRQTSAYLEEHGFLAAKAYIYLEAKELITDNELPSNWHLIKSKRAGHVYYHLAVREND